MELKKYTQEEFDALPVVAGWRLCPSGDYSLIKSFGEGCSFRKGCICEFGTFHKLATVGGFGSESRTTYFFLLDDGNVSVRCGCFSGTLEEWENKVKDTHGDSAFAKSYLLAGQAVRALWEIG